MDVRAHLRYSADHQWALVTSGAADGNTDAAAEGGTIVRVGITDYAQDALGDIVFVDLPTAGDTVVVDKPLSEVESTKSVSDVFAPVSGTITAVNDALEDAPHLINEDPYGEGWICELRAEDPAAVDTLLSAEAYQELTGENDV